MALAAGRASFGSSITAGSRSIPTLSSGPLGPIALNRKNALFAGSDGVGEHWAILASLVETAKLNGINPQAYLADILACIASDHPINRIDELLPWTWVANRGHQKPTG